MSVRSVSKSGHEGRVNDEQKGTMRNEPTFFDMHEMDRLIENPINRYLVNSPMLPGMKKKPDGSLTIYIQKDSPGKIKESNRLPAPDGLIYMVMRLYWPKQTPPSILPPGEGTWSPPAIVVSK